MYIYVVDTGAAVAKATQHCRPRRLSSPPPPLFPHSHSSPYDASKQAIKACSPKNTFQNTKAHSHTWLFCGTILRPTQQHNAHAIKQILGLSRQGNFCGALIHPPGNLRTGCTQFKTFLLGILDPFSGGKGQDFKVRNLRTGEAGPLLSG